VPNKFHILVFALILLLWSCPPPPPGSLVVVPASDNTPLTLAMDVYDPDLIPINQTAPSVTIVAVSDVVSVIGSATDDDGGIKAIKMWATYTYSNPGVTSGPGLVSAPVNESVSSAKVGESTLKSRTVAYNFDLKKELGGWSRVEVNVWIEGENFYGGHAQTPFVTLTYPTRQGGDTDYMAYCRKARVPIPPDWSLTTTAWALQGNLGTGRNLLQPGLGAFVWTYSDPIRRGACIALPRTNGGTRGGLAGVICQSATTGRACFWDSRKRDENDPSKQVPIPINWSTEGLKIAELKDGSNLNDPGSGRCTDCHRGNNAFLMAPDDPAWANVLRGSVATSPGSRFTTRVEASSDMSGGHPRYVPVTYPANRPDWVNPPQAVGCAGGCHEDAQDFKSRDSGIPDTPPMPPACAPGNKVELCYK
jgi:hypothetical protein